MLYAGTVNSAESKIETRNKIFIKMSEGKKGNWLDKGEGGEWYEPFITNRDTIQIAIITFAVCGLIILLITFI